MNYWKEKIDFWRNKTSGNDIYLKQKDEIAFDIRTLIDALDIATVIDVGGYKGELGKLLPEKIKYINLDIVDGFDVTYEWTHQLIEKDIVLSDPDHTLALTSLFLICIRPEAVQHVLTQMRKYSSVQYYFEEKAPKEIKLSDVDFSAQINNEYGGKWAYDWEKVIGDIDQAPSEVNPNWVKMFSK